MDLSTKHVCTYCGRCNVIAANEISQESGVAKESGYEVTYYKCPGCKKENVVQIDNYQSLDVRTKLIKLIVRKSGKHIKEVDRITRERLESRLRETRRKLKESLKGESITLNSGKIIKIN